MSQFWICPLPPCGCTSRVLGRLEEQMEAALHGGDGLGRGESCLALPASASSPPAAWQGVFPGGCCSPNTWDGERPAPVQSPRVQ